MTCLFRGGSREGVWGGGGDPQPPLFVDQSEAQRAKKRFLETGPPPYLRVWMTAPSPRPHLSQGLDPALLLTTKCLPDEVKEPTWH